MTRFHKQKTQCGNRVSQTMRFRSCRQELLNKIPDLFTGMVRGCRESIASDLNRQSESFHRVRQSPLLSRMKTSKTWAPTSQQKSRFEASNLSLLRKIDSVYSQISSNEKVYEDRCWRPGSWVTSLPAEISASFRRQDQPPTWFIALE